MGIYICRTNEHPQRCIKNYKYTIDWQCERLRLKDIKDLSSKLSYARIMFERYKEERSDQCLSVINWLNGLSLTYGGEDRENIKVKADNWYKELEGLYLKEEGPSSDEEIEQYDRDLLRKVLSDNLSREIMWLRKYYVHVGLDTFVNRLAAELGCSEKWFEKEDLLAQCDGHKSEWSFIY